MSRIHLQGIFTQSIVWETFTLSAVEPPSWKPPSSQSEKIHLKLISTFFVWTATFFTTQKKKIKKGKEKDGPRPVKTTCAPSQYLQCRPCVNDLTDRGPPQKWPTAFFGVHSISFKGKRRPSQVTKTRERLLTFCWQLHVCRWRKSLHWHFVQSKRVAVSCVDRKWALVKHLAPPLAAYQLSRPEGTFHGR